jgi:hypothetical protein
MTYTQGQDDSPSCDTSGTCGGLPDRGASSRPARPCSANRDRHRTTVGSGVAVRVLQRLLALTAVIWHNDKTGAGDPAVADRL